MPDCRDKFLPARSNNPGAGILIVARNSVPTEGGRRFFEHKATVGRSLHLSASQKLRTQKEHKQITNHGSRTGPSVDGDKSAAKLVFLRVELDPLVRSNGIAEIRQEGPGAGGSAHKRSLTLLSLKPARL
ncbi:MAG: hypothetical protein MK110_10435 [Fuerstiella sp.]|nr:hypothetical protein [Fuerstiella sp.]